MNGLRRSKVYFYLFFLFERIHFFARVWNRGPGDSPLLVTMGKQLVCLRAKETRRLPQAFSKVKLVHNTFLYPHHHTHTHTRSDPGQSLGGRQEGHEGHENAKGGDSLWARKVLVRALPSFQKAFGVLSDHGKGRDRGEEQANLTQELVPTGGGEADDRRASANGEPWSGMGGVQQRNSSGE